MRKKAEEIGKYAAKAPQTEADLRSTLFGSDQTLASLRENEAAKIKELYEHDKILASNYVPQTPGFIEDPGAKARFGSDVLARQGGELADIQKGIANRRDVLGEALDKGMAIFTAGLDALKFEYGGIKDQGSFALELQKMAEARAEREQTRREKNRATERVNIGGQEVLIDSNTGETIRVLGPAGTDVKAGDKTAEYISQVKTYKNRVEALKDFEIYKSTMVQQGVDVDAVKRAIDSYFPESPVKTSSESTTPGIAGHTLWNDLSKLIGGGR